jgi:hypothetical protein
MLPKSAFEIGNTSATILTDGPFCQKQAEMPLLFIRKPMAR